MFEIAMTREVDEKFIQIWTPVIITDGDGDDTQSLGE